jgi:hypothetical protein
MQRRAEVFGPASLHGPQRRGTVGTPVVVVAVENPLRRDHLQIVILRAIVHSVR